MADVSAIARAKGRAEAGLLARPGVVGVDVGYKYVGGRRTHQLCVRVFVAKKRGDVPERERVPAEIDGVPTDVIERTFRPAADDSRYDPLRGGISFGLGTLGAVVQDRRTGDPVLLTTFHGTRGPGDDVCQPLATACGPSSLNRVGSVLRTALSARADAAVCSFAGRDWQNWIQDVGPVGLAADAPAGTPVRKRGRTTELTYGSVDGVLGSFTIPGYPGGPMTFLNLIQIAPDTSKNEVFLDSGDSGSLIVSAFTNATFGATVLGLGIAGQNGPGGFALATPIGQVLSELEVDLYGFAGRHHPPPPHVLDCK